MGGPAMATIEVERPADRPGLVIVRLNRPEKLNAINNEMHQELQDLCHALQTDGEARVLILTGNGRAFSAGADLGSAPNIGEARRTRLSGERQGRPATVAVEQAHQRPCRGWEVPDRTIINQMSTGRSRSPRGGFDAGRPADRVTAGTG